MYIYISMYIYLRKLVTLMEHGTVSTQTIISGSPEFNPTMPIMLNIIFLPCSFGLKVMIWPPTSGANP